MRIVVHGAPASGKTRLAQELGVPLLSMGQIKETLFDHFEHGTIPQSDHIGMASLDVLWLWLETLMRAATTSFIVETAFPGEQSETRIRRPAEDHGYRLAQVFCHTDEHTLRRRYIERALTPDRHPGHRDLERVEGQPIPEESSFRAMELPGVLIDLDTTHLDLVRYDEIFQALKPTLLSTRD